MLPKLLFLGADTSTEDAVRYAKSIGVYTIVTDYREKEKVPEKQMADEAWMIDVADTDALEKRCREEGVTAVFAGNQEFCLDQCKALCKRLSLPFYAANDGWQATRNKIFFKEVCVECGLDTPAWISLNENTESETIKQLRFPVIVKPVDSFAQQGVSVVRSPVDLIPAYQKALPFSKSGKVIAEEFVDGDEILIYTYVHQGKLIFLGAYEHFPAEIRGRRNIGFLAHEGRFNPYIKKEILPRLEKVVQRLGCREGACLFQSMYKDGILYNFELGYRLDGTRTCRHHKRVYGMSELEPMVDLALGIVDEEKIAAFRIPKDSYKTSAAYCLWARPGRVQKIIGLEEIEKRKDMMIQIRNFKEGDTVPNLDNMRSIGYGICVYGDSHQELDAKIKEISKTIHMIDVQGNEMLIYLDGYYDTWMARMKKGL